MSEKRSPEWQRGFNHLCNIDRFCRDYRTSWQGGPTPLPRLWCEVLFLRSLAALNSVAVLVRNDCIDDAAIIVRSLFEIEFQIGAIKKDSQVAAQLIGTTEVGRLKRLKNLSKAKGTLPEGMTAIELDQKLEEARKFSKKLTQEALAAKANRDKEYDRFYRTLSEIAHASAIGLRHFVVEGPDGVLINSNSGLFSPELVMALACATQLEILNIIREMRKDRNDQKKFESLVLENGEIICSVHSKGL
jgi:hypothetical protein